MKNIKYTTDGKKVVVIGDLNQTEKIVQEIFITEQGDEIPQGERFVVKSLLDEPSKSWKERTLEDLEAKYEKEKKYWDNKIDSITKEKNNAYDALSARVKWLRAVAKEPRDGEFKRVIDTIADFFTGSEKWVCVKKYSGWELERFNEDGVNSLIDSFDDYHNRLKFDSMRLLSLYGKSDGNVEFRVNTYSDGSGSNDPVVFFKSKEEALVFMQNEFDKVAKYSDAHFKTAERYDLKIDAEKLKLFQEKNKETINRYISEAELQIEKYKKELIALSNGI